MILQIKQFNFSDNRGLFGVDLGSQRLCCKPPTALVREFPRLGIMYDDPKIIAANPFRDRDG